MKNAGKSPGKAVRKPVRGISFPFFCFIETISRNIQKQMENRKYYREIPQNCISKKRQRTV